MQNQSCPSFKPILTYFENNYIGKLKSNSITARKEPRFPIEHWNLYERVKRDLPRTTNNMENWHGKVTMDEKKHLTVNKTVELCRKEQGQMEANYVKLNKGELLRVQSKKQKEKDENITRLVRNYKIDNIDEFLTGISMNMGEQKIN